jgi:hypothetical protein
MSGIGLSRHEILRLASVAFGCRADMAGSAAGSTRSRLTQSGHLVVWLEIIRPLQATH